MSRKYKAILASLALSFLAPLIFVRQPATQLEYRETDVAARSWPKDAVRAPQAMVVSDNALADKAGLEILKKGGNAVDTAAAVAFALAVVEPRAGNIGGGGFLLVRLASGKTVFVDYREEAPASATRELYRKPDGTYDGRVLSHDGHSYEGRFVKDPGLTDELISDLDERGLHDLRFRMVDGEKKSVVASPHMKLSDRLDRLAVQILSS